MQGEPSQENGLMRIDRALGQEGGASPGATCSSLVHQPGAGQRLRVLQDAHVRIGVDRG